MTQITLAHQKPTGEQHFEWVSVPSLSLRAGPARRCTPAVPLLFGASGLEEGEAVDHGSVRAHRTNRRSALRRVCRGKDRVGRMSGVVGVDASD